MWAGDGNEHGCQDPTYSGLKAMAFKGNFWVLLSFGHSTNMPQVLIFLLNWCQLSSTKVESSKSTT